MAESKVEHTKTNKTAESKKIKTPSEKNGEVTKTTTTPDAKKTVSGSRPAKKFNALKWLGISVGVLVLIFLLAGIGVYAWYQQSAYKAYEEVSGLIKDQENFESLIACEDFKANFLNGAVAQDSGSSDINLCAFPETDSTEMTEFYESIDDEVLADNALEALTNDSFQKQDKSYELELDYEISGLKDTLTLVFEKKDGDWKIVDIQLSDEIESYYEGQ